MSEEVWLPVRDYEGLYEVSSHARIRRVGRSARTGKGRGCGAVIGRILKQHVTPFGYLSVPLWKGGKFKNFQVHRLVADVFCGGLIEGHEVNHIDGVKTHNEPENLEVVSRSENIQHAYRLGLMTPSVIYGERHHMASLTDEQVETVRSLYSTGKWTGVRLARKFGVNHSTIYRIVKFKTRKDAAHG